MRLKTKHILLHSCFCFDRIAKKPKFTGILTDKTEKHPLGITRSLHQTIKTRGLTLIIIVNFIVLFDKIQCRFSGLNKERSG